MNLLIAKVGGSLFDMPDLKNALFGWLAEQPEERIMLVAGGGDFVEAVRKYQPVHGLSEVEAHWLAVRAMGLSAKMLAHMLESWPIVPRFEGHLKSILDCFAFLRSDESESDALPESWTVSSDTIALHAAKRFGALRLVLLKSSECEIDADWQSSANRGYVDEHFPRLASACQFPIQCLDLRHRAGIMP